MLRRDGKGPPLHHYNLARIYENADQFCDALQHDQMAKQNKAHPAYNKGIQRMKDKL